jgi:rhamnosyl/mannosyltransferase
MVPHRKPVVVTYHSDIVKQKLLLKLYSPLMHRFLARADRIIATSPNYLASSPVLQRYRHKIEVIPLGLDEADYAAVEPQRIQHWQERFANGFLLFVGVLRYYKGIHILYEAAKLANLPIVVVGGGEAEGDFRRRAHEDGLENLHFLGALEDADKTALLTLCRAFVFPSHLRSEAFGLSLVEAAMAGKPMISCEIGTGTSYVNLKGETGITIAPADPQALASAMQVLWNDEALCARYGAAARRRYETMFTAARMTQSYAEIYRQLAGKQVG